MARISLISENATPEIAALAAKIRGARGGRLQAFYGALLHSLGLTSAWFHFNNAVRFESVLDERVRELAIMRVAFLTRCDYVWHVHETRYAGAAGITPEQIAALRDGAGRGHFAPRERALLDYVDAVTREASVTDAVFDALRAGFPDREIVELTVLIGAYNMQARLINALGFTPDGA